MKKILSVLLATVLLFSVSAVALADYSNPKSIWNEWGNSGGLGGVIIGYICGDRCALSTDHYHHASTYNSKTDTYLVCTCDLCGHEFRAYNADLRAAYFSGGSGKFGDRGDGYYTCPTTTTQINNNTTKNYYRGGDTYYREGDVVNYYRSGDTTNISLVDTYTNSFNTINNNSYTTTNTTYNSYTANVHLTTYLNQYTYNTTNNYYQQTYNSYTYNTTNNVYYVTIDNSTTNNYDYHYDIEYTYAPQYTAVTYVSSDPTINNVTNVYYYALYDGRNSYDLSADEINGLATDYNSANYDLVSDSPDVLSLQHFDGNYDDSSSYSRDRYDGGQRSTTYIDSGAFGQAVDISNLKAGVSFSSPVSASDGFQIDFRFKCSNSYWWYYLNLFCDDVCLFGKLPNTKNWIVYDDYDNPPNSSAFTSINLSSSVDTSSEGSFTSRSGNTYSYSLPESIFKYSNWSSYTSPSYSYDPTLSSLGSLSSAPTANSSGYSSYSSNYFGAYYWDSSDPTLVTSSEVFNFFANNRSGSKSRTYTDLCFEHYFKREFVKIPVNVSREYPSSFNSSDWNSFRFSYKDGNAYIFINGDLYASGAFSISSFSDIYVFGNVGYSNYLFYIDELRIINGSNVSTSTYTPATSPFDTNMVLARPTNPENGKIYVRSSIESSSLRVGGVRPSNPSTGFTYIPLDSNYEGVGCSIFDGSNWVDCDAYLYENDSWHEVLGYRFYTVADYETVVEPSSDDPSDPGGGGSDNPSDPGGGGTDDPSDPGGGNSDDPSSGGGNGESSDDESLFTKIGNLLGSILEGILHLLTSVLSKVLDGLSWLAGELLDKLGTFVDVVLSVFEKIPELFGGFLDFLGTGFSFIPDDIMLIITFGILAVVIIGIIRAIRGQ